MLALVAAAILTAAPRTLDWPTAAAELELLETFAPLATDVPRAPFIKVGGVCRQVGADGKVKLGEGSADGHTWYWSLEVKAAKGSVAIDGPNAKHGYDVKGKAKTFTDKGPTRRWFIGPAQGDWWPLFAEAHTLELACWAVDESNGVCEGKPKTCKKCSTVRLIGGPRGGQHVYGDGVIRANLNETCDAMCTGPGLTWAEYETLAALVKRSRVVDLEAPAQGHLFRTQAACEAGASDLDARFQPVEPPDRL